MLNKQILIGFLGQDPERIHFDNGRSITRFSLATSETWNDKQTGEKKTATEWHNIVASNQLAELCEKYLKKGSKVYVEGKTRHRSYEQDGIKKYVTEVHVREIKFLSKTEQGTPLDNMPNKPNNSQASNQDRGVVDDSLPF